MSHFYKIMGVNIVQEREAELNVQSLFFVKLVRLAEMCFILLYYILRLRRTYGACLEIGCGTWNSTSWLAETAAQVTARDSSDEMLAKAKEKITSDRAKCVQADSTNN